MSKLYMRDTSVGLGTFGTSDRSDVKPVGSMPYSPNAVYNMLAAKGAAQVLIENRSSDPVTTHQDACMGRFFSEPIGVSQVDANVWTIAVAVAEANTNANAFLGISLYVITSNDIVRGYIYDLDTVGGTTEFATAEAGRIVTVSGVAVAGCVSTDRVVCEVWWHTASQGMASSYTRSLWVNGTTDPVDGVATSNAASYVNTPQDLFPVGSPVSQNEEFLAFI